VAQVDRSTRRDDTVLAWPVHAAFAVNGLLFATWVSRLPAVRERLDASEPQLGSVLLCIAIGSLVSMPFTSRLCDRFGVHRVLTVAMLGCAVAFELAVLAPSIPTLGVVLFALGTVFGTWDVAMNSSAHEVEVRTGRPLMPRFHGAFSVGGLSGGALGAVAAGVGLPVPVHMAGAVVVAAVTVMVAVPLLPEPPQHAAAATVDTASGPRRIPIRLVALGLLTACTTLGEGAAADWGALFLHDERGASESTAALGYAVFCCAMAIGRFGGTWVLSRIERVWALRWSGVAVSASLVVLVAIDVIPVSLLAMAGWGFGVAIVFPAAMSAAAEHAARPAQGIAVVATIGYGGFLVGPPLIGFLAGHVGLGSALWVVAGLGVVLFALSVSAAPRQRPAVPIDGDVQPAAPEFLRL
jgi:MFS family permease